jgi:glycosyltransferase involved in cell wall biosynthesis
MVVVVERLKITALIIARNEAGLITRAIRSCANYVDEVVVVDAFSTDSTVALAQAAGARVVQRAWTGFGDQRNFSLTQARNDWVLVLDADEAATIGLQDWLTGFFRSGLNLAAPWGYKLKRAEYFLGRRIYGACWNPSFQDRFFRRDKANYVGVIHEYPIAEGGFVRAPESALIDHNPAVTVESFFEKMNRYTTIEARDRFEAGQRTSLSHLGVVFFATWAKNYFKYKGYRDGAHGFVICLMEAVSRTVRHIKLWQLQRLASEGRLASLPDPRSGVLASSHRLLEAQEPALSAGEVPE